jgi:hypothetical protein
MRESRIVSTAALALLGVAWMASATGAGAVHASAATARQVVIEFADGRRVSASLEGVGCSQAMCSRVALRAREQGAAMSRTAFAAIGRIVTVGGGDAEVVLEDGTSHRMAIAEDNRVLYVNANGRTRKVPLADVTSIQFIDASRGIRGATAPGPRTPWGDPDLQGTWSGTESLGVPTERDRTLGDRNTLTQAEFEARQLRLSERASSGGIEATDFSAESELVRYRSRQASLVIDPPDGRRPARTPEAEARRPARNSFVPGLFDSISDLGLFDRCIAWNAVGLGMPVNTLQIVQAPGYVALRAEVTVSYTL